jgi:hypothetical protein
MAGVSMYLGSEDFGPKGERDGGEIRGLEY